MQVRHTLHSVQRVHARKGCASHHPHRPHPFVILAYFIGRPWLEIHRVNRPVHFRLYTHLRVLIDWCPLRLPHNSLDFVHRLVGCRVRLDPAVGALVVGHDLVRKLRAVPLVLHDVRDGNALLRHGDENAAEQVATFRRHLRTWGGGGGMTIELKRV